MYIDGGRQQKWRARTWFMMERDRKNHAVNIANKLKREIKWTTKQRASDYRLQTLCDICEETQYLVVWTLNRRVHVGIERFKKLFIEFMNSCHHSAQWQIHSAINRLGIYVLQFSASLASRYVYLSFISYIFFFKSIAIDRCCVHAM